MITKYMSPLEIVEKYPETKHVFHEYDDVLGKCLLCYFLFDSIENIAAKHNLNIEEMLDRINSSIGSYD